MTYPIYTIGYSGWKPEALKAAVESRDALLWDIRMRPWSRALQWRQPALRTLLGARYVYEAALGNRNYNNDGPIELAAPWAALPAAREVLAHQPLILLCGCKAHQGCHRTAAAAYLAEDSGAVVEHLYPPIVKAAGNEGYYPLPSGEAPTVCKSCGAAIVWTRTLNAKAIPLDLAHVRGEGAQREALTHYATCLHSREWRRSTDRTV